MTTLLVAVAGAAGATFRYRIALAVGPRAFPWGTLGINLSGCAILAVLLAGPGTRWSPTTTTALAVGLLGGYTTFSTFGYETLTLLRTDRPLSAAAYVTASVIGGLAASAAGYLVGRGLA